MGETQIYSQRLHEITEKRRILSEVDRIQRELEQQKLKLQQLKRKSLRDRWLMEGLAPVPGLEADNPLTQTEDIIQYLKREMESLQSQLVHLENPELNIVKAMEVQGPTLHRKLVNGDGNQQVADQKENHEEKTIIKEVDPLDNSQGEKPMVKLVDPSQKDLTQATDGLVEKPIPLPRGIKAPKNDQVEHNINLEFPELNDLDQNQTHQGQNLEHIDQNDEEGHHEHLKQDQKNEMQNLNHSQEHQDVKQEHLDQDGEHGDQSLDQEHVDKDQDLHNQNCERLDKSLEPEEHNLEHLTQRLAHVDLNFDTEGHKPESSLANEDISKSRDDNATLLGESTKLVILENQKEEENQIQHGTLPTAERLQDQKSMLMTSDHKIGQHFNENQNQDQNDELVISFEKPQNEDSVFPTTQDKTKNPEMLFTDQGSTQPVEDPKHDPPFPCRYQNLDSTSLPMHIHQSPVLPSRDQERNTTLPFKDQDPISSLPHEDQNQAGQVQISQVVVIAAPGLPQYPSNSQQGPSASRHPGTIETNTPVEYQPLLPKPQETDTQQRPQGANTAETREKKAPVKKKTCQCCAAM